MANAGNQDWVVFSKDKFDELLAKGEIVDVVNFDVGVRGGYMIIKGERIQVLDPASAKVLIPALLVARPVGTAAFSGLLKIAPLV